MAITATYLSMMGGESGKHTEGGKRNRTIIEYHLPTKLECMEPLLNSNLPRMGCVDIVIMGYVHGLEELTSDGEWEGEMTTNSLHGRR
jgi:hypothetical protein